MFGWAAFGVLSQEDWAVQDKERTVQDTSMDEPDDFALEDGQLLEIAAAISDGTPIDWSGHDWPRMVSGASDESPLISRLQQVELIVRGHQRLIESLSSAVSAGTSAAAETLLTEAGRTVSTNENPLRVEWGPLIVLDKIRTRLVRRRLSSVGPPPAPRGGPEARCRQPRGGGDTRFRGRPSSGASASSECRGGLWRRTDQRSCRHLDGVHFGGVRSRTRSREGPVSAQEAARIGIEVCRALSAVHAAGLLHRDVKAQNVMREAEGRIVPRGLGTGIRLG